MIHIRAATNPRERDIHASKVLQPEQRRALKTCFSPVPESILRLFESLVSCVTVLADEEGSKEVLSS